MKRFAKGSSILMIGELITKVLAIVYLIPLVVIDPNLSGMTTEIIVTFALALTLASFGINVIMTNEIAKNLNVDKNMLKTSLINGFSLLMAFSFIAFIVMFIFAENIVSFTYDMSSPYVQDYVIGLKIASFGVILFGISAFISSCLIGVGEYARHSVSLVIEQIFKLIIILGLSYIAFVKMDMSLGVMYIITAISIIAPLIIKIIYLLYSLFRYDKFRMFRVGKYIREKKYVRILLFTGIVYAIGTIYVSIFDYIDISLLQNLYSNTVPNEEFLIVKNEYVSLSYKFVMIPIQLSGAFISVMFRELTQDGKKTDTFNSMLELIIVYSILSVLGLGLIGQDMLDMMYPSASFVGLISVQIMIIPFFIIKNFLTSYTATNTLKPRTIVISTVVLIISKIILSIVLFKVMSFYGFIVGSILAIIISTLYLIKSNTILFNFTKVFKYKALINIRKGVVLAIMFVIISIVINSFMLPIILALIIKFILAIVLIAFVYRGYVRMFIGGI